MPFSDPSTIVKNKKVDTNNDFSSKNCSEILQDNIEKNKT